MPATLTTMMTIATNTEMMRKMTIPAASVLTLGGA